MSDEPRLSVAFISVGSNIEPERNILAALTALASKTQVTGSSTFYRTTPIGRADQPMYVNGVWQIHTHLEPVQVQEALLRPIEALLGRRRSTGKFASRTIDLDLVLYGDLVSQATNLKLPHPDVARPFVCGPILELLERNNVEIEPRLKGRIIELLPEGTLGTRPGDVLSEFTRQLRVRIRGDSPARTSRHCGRV